MLFGQGEIVPKINGDLSKLFNINRGKYQAFESISQLIDLQLVKNYACSAI